MPSNKLLQAAAGSAGDDNLFPEDVFSTFLYTGNNSTLAINNGLDLSGEGGLVWLKGRNGVFYHRLYDTARGIQNGLSSNVADAQTTNNQGMTAVTSTGFTLGTDGVGNTNPNNYNMASWSWRKAEGFFDIITFDGSNGSGYHNFNHNLGSTPKCIIVKRTDGIENWFVYHASLASDGSQHLQLNTNSAADTGGGIFGTPTSTTFNVQPYAMNMTSGSNTAVAYLFGDDAVFGEDGDEQICKMGTVTTNGSGTASINLGFEPQFIMAKATNAAENWFIVDIMNGAPNGGDETYLQPNLSSAFATYDFVDINPTGWDFKGLNANQNYIYMAIRRPMKVPEAGTEVFAAAQSANNAAWFTSGFPVDLSWVANPNSGGGIFNVPRITAKKLMYTNTNAAEASQSNADFDYMTGAWDGQNNTDYFAWMFKRAPKFFDVVAYTGTGSNRTVTHNLSIAPEMMLVKNRTDSQHWAVYHKHYGGTHWAILNEMDNFATSSTIWNNTNTTASVFTVGTASNTNQSSKNYIAYLFGSVDGVSKVGSYTGNGSTQTIDCGFSAGARFVLIKKSSEYGLYMVFDSVRGIVSGNSPYINLNDASAEVTNTDKIDPAASGFAVNVGDGYQSDANESGQTYIFLAIA